jgi:flagellar motor switch protein FliG
MEFSFEHIIFLNDESKKIIIETIPLDYWAYSLQGASPDMHAFVETNLTPETREILFQRMKEITPVTYQDLVFYQNKIVDIITGLDKINKIHIDWNNLPVSGEIEESIDNPACVQLCDIIDKSSKEDLKTITDRIGPKLIAEAIDNIKKGTQEKVLDALDNQKRKEAEEYLDVILRTGYLSLKEAKEAQEKLLKYFI